jgi:hypothetical protein
LGQIFDIKHVVIGKFGHGKISELFLGILMEDLIFFMGLEIVNIDGLLCSFAFRLALGCNIRLVSVFGEGLEDLLVLFIFVVGFLLDVLAVGHLETTKNARFVHFSMAFNYVCVIGYSFCVIIQSLNEIFNL